MLVCFQILMLDEVAPIWSSFTKAQFVNVHKGKEYLLFFTNVKVENNAMSILTLSKVYILGRGVIRVVGKNSTQCLNKCRNGQNTKDFCY